MTRSVRSRLLVGMQHLSVMSGMTLMLLGPAASPVAGEPITLAVNPALVTGSPIPGFFEVDFVFGNELDGITLSGQSISLDFVFADKVLARVLAFGGLTFGALLSLQTDAGTLPGFFGDDSTGFLLAANGSPVHSALPREWVGLAASSAGSSIIGLFPQVSGYFDISGVHYDISLPATGFSITGGQIRLASNSEWANIQFGTAAQLPEPSTLLLFTAGAACVTCVRMTVSRRNKRLRTRSL